MPRPQTARAVDLIRAGCTLAEAARAAGVAESTVLRACRAAGVPLPGRQPQAAPMIPVSIKMRPDQRDKLQRMTDGPARVREWIDAAPIDKPAESL